MTPWEELSIALVVASACIVALIAATVARSWLRVRALSAHLPAGFVCNEYSGAFDTGPGKCRFCDADLLQLRKRAMRVSPRGKEFGRHTEYAGVACLSCLIAANDDLDRATWVKLEDFCRGEPAAPSNARLAAEAQ